MGNGESLLNQYRVSVWDDEKALEIDSGTLHTYSVPLNSTLKFIKMLHFVLYFTTIKQISRVSYK